MLNVSRHDPARDSQPARHPLDAVRRGAPDQPVFCFELGSPECWLAAERILPALAVVAEWLPVAFGPDPAPDREALARRAAALGVLPPRWPAAWPPDTGTAMRAVTYARQSGKTVAFALAAFRQAFAAGRDLGDPDTLALAGAAAEIHPRALLTGVRTAAVARDLEQATEAARAAGVRTVPAIVTPEGAVFEGAECVEEAAAA